MSVFVTPILILLSYWFCLSFCLANCLFFIVPSVFCPLCPSLRPSVLSDKEQFFCHFFSKHINLCQSSRGWLLTSYQAANLATASTHQASTISGPMSAILRHEGKNGTAYCVLCFMPFFPYYHLSHKQAFVSCRSSLAPGFCFIAVFPFMGFVTLPFFPLYLVLSVYFISEF